MKDTQYINAVLLLLLAFLPNYTGTLVGCKLGRLIESSNVVLKFAYVVLLVFACFTVVDGEHTHPLMLVKHSLMVVFLFNMFNRQKYHSLVISLLLLVGLIFIHKWVKHCDKFQDDKHQNMVIYLKKIEQMVYILLMTVLCVGFGAYLIEKRTEFGPKFDYLTFFLGNEKCKNN